MQNQRINKSNNPATFPSDEQALAELTEEFKVVRPPCSAERPKASDQKLRIISWMMYWPVSVFNYLVFDMIRELFDAIYKRVSKVYNKITDSVYGAESEDERNI